MSRPETFGDILPSVVIFNLDVQEGELSSHQLGLLVDPDVPGTPCPESSLPICKEAVARSVALGTDYSQAKPNCMASVTTTKKYSWAMPSAWGTIICVGVHGGVELASAEMVHPGMVLIRSSGLQLPRKLKPRPAGAPNQTSPEQRPK